MRAIHVQIKQEYGWPRMHKELLGRNIRVGKERIWSLMHQHGPRAKPKFVVTTDSRHNLPVAPDLARRRFNPKAPNQLWSGDITYLATDAHLRARAERLRAALAACDIQQRGRAIAHTGSRLTAPNTTTGSQRSCARTRTN